MGRLRGQTLEQIAAQTVSNRLSRLRAVLGTV
jgi:hypothetical protein